MRIRRLSRRVPRSLPTKAQPMATRPKRPVNTPSSIHVLRVELLDIHPTIWRELHIPSHTSLDRLHAVIQAAFGWQNSHLHMFEGGEGLQYGDLSLDEDAELDQLDERQYTVESLGP